MAELADAQDLKSCGLNTRTGSIPVLGIKPPICIGGFFAFKRTIIDLYRQAETGEMLQFKKIGYCKRPSYDKIKGLVSKVLSYIL